MEHNLFNTREITMSHIYQCEVCSKSFNMNNYEKCPSCKTPYIDPRAKEIAEANPFIDEPTPTNKVEAKQPATKPVVRSASQSVDPLVEAQNRTTHAVRALAITFVAAPILLFVVGGFLLFAVNSGEIGLIVVALIIGVAAFGWILVSSLSELAKSYVR